MTVPLTDITNPTMLSTHTVTCHSTQFCTSQLKSSRCSALNHQRNLRPHPRRGAANAGPGLDVDVFGSHC
jgi:hypothetical protein